MTILTFGSVGKELKAEWKEKMQAMESDGFTEKDKFNMHLNSVKHKDLGYLKNKDGPFTTSEGVDIFMDQIQIDPKEKNHRLYVEVRYAKNTSLRLKHDSDCVFRLSRNNQNLSSKEYSENLKTYLGSVRKTTTIYIYKRII